jgi:hypothetical protein
MKTSRSYNQHKLKFLCDELCDNIESLFDVLGLEDIKYNGKMYVGCCPIHNGDNNTAFNLYPYGDNYRGNWRCRTHNCDKVFKGSIIGFVRGVLSNQKYNWQGEKDKTISFDETIKFVESFLGKDLDKIKINKTEIEKKTFANIIKNIGSLNIDVTNKISRSNVRNSLKIPCEYFMNRGYSEEVLSKYDVGLCHKPEKEMYNRAVAPIYDLDHKYMVGCTGRSIFNKCPSCESYHSTDMSCPSSEDQWKYSKWKHSFQFKSQNYLYNLWFAKSHILNSHKVILVESPGNVWKLEENGIHNSVALFGSNLSDKQKILLDGSGAMTIISIMDSDDAGRKASETIKSKCKNTYNIIDIKISKPDISEMTTEEIEKEIKAYL